MTGGVNNMTEGTTLNLQYYSTKEVLSDVWQKIWTHLACESMDLGAVEDQILAHELIAVMIWVDTHVKMPCVQKETSWMSQYKLTTKMIQPGFDDGIYPIKALFLGVTLKQILSVSLVQEGWNDNNECI